MQSVEHAGLYQTLHVRRARACAGACSGKIITAYDGLVIYQATAGPPRGRVGRVARLENAPTHLHVAKTRMQRATCEERQARPSSADPRTSVCCFKSHANSPPPNWGHRCRERSLSSDACLLATALGVRHVGSVYFGALPSPKPHLVRQTDSPASRCQHEAPGDLRPVEAEGPTAILR